ncbi:hypothetical protein DFQ28_008902 [Apophysomyces sp. BC1034]|nr:hypothetical protein DFQ30_006209 [Apophysomyces sp. BC1015]KAG0181780.1 hypothetical protein DFQ29_007108 [Apophysomyces sp. BC1021]KAG0192510.1 hypothetical protein DFQ28_008902 [Apophysomyces sp. BC1034]
MVTAESAANAAAGMNLGATPAEKAFVCTTGAFKKQYYIVYVRSWSSDPVNVYGLDATSNSEVQAKVRNAFPYFIWAYGDKCYGTLFQRYEHDVHGIGVMVNWIVLNQPQGGGGHVDAGCDVRELPAKFCHVPKIDESDFNTLGSYLNGVAPCRIVPAG